MKPPPVILYSKLSFMHSVIYNYCPPSFLNIWLLKHMRNEIPNLCNKNLLNIPHPRINCSKNPLSIPSLNSGTHWMTLNSRTIILRLGYLSKANFSITLISYNKANTTINDKKKKKIPYNQVDSLMLWVKTSPIVIYIYNLALNLPFKSTATGLPAPPPSSSSPSRLCPCVWPVHPHLMN